MAAPMSTSMDFKEQLVSYKTYRDTYRNTYQISRYASLVEKVYRYTPRTFHRCFPPNFSSFWLSSFREDFQKSTNQKQELPMAAMFVNGSGRNQHSLQNTFHRCFLPSFGSFGQAVSEEKNFLNLYRYKCILNKDIYI